MNDRRLDRTGVTTANVDPDFGIETQSAARIRALCETTVGLAGLWIFGSRARGDHQAHSDIDLEADAPGWTHRDYLVFIDFMKHLPIVYPIDCVWRQGALTEEFRERIARDRKLFWTTRQEPADNATGPPVRWPAAGSVTSSPPPDRPSPPAA